MTKQEKIEQLERRLKNRDVIIKQLRERQLVALDALTDLSQGFGRTTPEGKWSFQKLAAEELCRVAKLPLDETVW